jgi:hypothetical protein
MWAPPGVNWLKMYNQKALAWIAVGNEYEDGTLEVGHIMYLKDKVRYAITKYLKIRIYKAAHTCRRCGEISVWKEERACQ